MGVLVKLRGLVVAPCMPQIELPGHECAWHAVVVFVEELKESQSWAAGGGAKEQG